MILALESSGRMEGRSSSSSSRRSAKEGRGPKRDKSPAAGTRHHGGGKAGKSPRGAGRKSGEPEGAPGTTEEPEEEEEEEQGSDKPHSTVVNVESVRDADGREETEESLGLLEREWQEEGEERTRRYGRLGPPVA